MLPIGQRAPTPKPKKKETSADAGKLEKSVKSRSDSLQDSRGISMATTAGISLGSPKSRAVQVKVDNNAAPLSLGDETPNALESVQLQSSLDKYQQPAKFLTEARTTTAAPTKFDPQPTMAATPIENNLIDSKVAPPLIASNLVATPQAIASGPSTPATTTSEISRASIPRPRTIRVTTSIPKAPAESAPPSAATERSATIPSSAQSHFKQPQRSRAHSFASAVSQSRPSTPAMSDRFSMTNDMLSRANSPPPSIVGSAPERAKTKAQQKKERKEKAKKATEVSDAGTSSTNATPPVVEEVAPVLGRQRKVKKHRPGTSLDGAKGKSNVTKSEDKQAFDEVASDSGVPDQDLDRPKEEPSELLIKRKESSEPTQPPTTKEKKRASKSSGFNSPVVEEPLYPKEEEVPLPKAPYTLLDLYTESAKHKHDPVFIQKLLNKHVSSIDQIFESLLKSKEIEPASAIFGNQPSLNSVAFKLPTDSRKGAEYLDANGYTDSNPFGHIYLGSKEKKALWSGESFGVADEREGRQGDLLRRALFTGGGAVYRHLTREQEDKVMELEARKDHYAAQWGDIGTMDKLGKLEIDDHMNIEGGVEALIRHGEKHGIGWMMSQSRDEWDINGEGDDEDGDQFDDDFEDEDDKIDDLELGNDPSTLGWDMSAVTGINAKALSALNAKLAGPKALPVTTPVNLRAMDNAQLQKRISDTQREMDTARKDMERMEKLMLKKTKEVAKWREGVGALRI